MIDIENLVFDTVYTGLHTSYPNANITAGYDEQNATFPTVVEGRQTISRTVKRTLMIVRRIIRE